MHQSNIHQKGVRVSPVIWKVQFCVCVSSILVVLISKQFTSTICVLTVTKLVTLHSVSGQSLTRSFLLNFLKNKKHLKENIIEIWELVDFVLDMEGQLKYSKKLTFQINITWSTYNHIRTIFCWTYVISLRTKPKYCLPLEIKDIPLTIKYCLPLGFQLVHSC